MQVYTSTSVTDPAILYAERCRRNENCTFCLPAGSISELRSVFVIRYTPYQYAYEDASRCLLSVSVARHCGSIITGIRSLPCVWKTLHSHVGGVTLVFKPGSVKEFSRRGAFEAHLHVNDHFPATLWLPLAQGDQFAAVIRDLPPAMPLHTTCYGGSAWRLNTKAANLRYVQTMK